MKLEAYLTPYIKMNSIGINNTNLSAETIKLLVGNIGVNLCELRLGKGFLDDNKCTSNQRKKIDELYFITILNFCAASNTIK